MNTIINAITLIIAFLHLNFLMLEMFFWTRPYGLKVFGQRLEQAQASASLAANQGLYNGFLAAGLIWGLLHPAEAFSLQLKVFFLSCVFLAGAYGGHSVARKIFYVQALPALIGLLLILITK
jgi:putative membrane protein